MYFRYVCVYLGAFIGVSMFACVYEYVYVRVYLRAFIGVSVFTCV